jgi:hypothetical protein
MTSLVASKSLRLCGKCDRKEIKVLRLDNGGEYTGKAFKELCA